MMSGALLVSRLCPMKRILCMCPVPKAFTEQSGHYDVGFAVSDPYLAHATPIDIVGYELQLSKSQNEVWSTLPPTAAELLQEIGYRDIGGVALALPMKQEDNGVQAYAFDGDKLKTARESLRRILSSYDDIGLMCYIEDRLTLNEAIDMAKKEPDMWEDIILEENSHATTHACVALNSFLWEHTGGWRNTFG